MFRMNENLGNLLFDLRYLNNMNENGIKLNMIMGFYDYFIIEILMILMIKIN